LVDSGVDSGSILLVISGSGTLEGNDGETVTVGFGDGIFISANTELRVKEGGGEGIKFVRGMRNVG
jgi:mannose-6-phosphate isomerase class I